MNENYENNYETIEETTVEFEPIEVVEADTQGNGMVIGIGAAAAIVIEHVLVPMGKKVYGKIKARKKGPKLEVIEAEVVDEAGDSDK